MTANGTRPSQPRASDRSSSSQPPPSIALQGTGGAPLENSTVIFRVVD
jgi:hypothetical protein